MSSEGIEPTRQPDVAEPDLREHCEELSLRESASDSTGPEINVAPDALGQLRLDHDVGE
jgi:hypothetical protein